MFPYDLFPFLIKEKKIKTLLISVCVIQCITISVLQMFDFFNCRWNNTTDLKKKKKNQPPTTNYSTCSKHRIWKQKEVKTRANIRLKLTCILGKRLSEPWNPPLQLLISNGFLLKIHSLFNSHFSNHIDIKYIYGDLFTSLFKDTQRIVHRELEVFSTWKRIPLKSEW